MDTKEAIRRMDIFEANWVALQFPNLLGEVKEIHISRADISESAFQEGIVVEELSEIFGEDRILRLVPRPETYGEIAWEVKTTRFISKIMDNGSRYEGDPTYPLERAIKTFKAIGAEQIDVRAEIGFSILENFGVDRVMKIRGPAVTFDAREGPWNPAGIYQREFVLSSFPHDAYYGVREQIVTTLRESFRYAVAESKHGSATAQQVVTSMRSNPLVAADFLFTLRSVAKAIAVLNNMTATFMPLPIIGQPGNRLTLEIALYRKEENLFSAGEELSDTARYFIGGILDHFSSLMLFTNPTANSFKRLRVEDIYPVWSYSNRKAAINVIVRSNSVFVRLNFPDAIVNPYLAMAAIFAAALDGIKKKIDPGEAVTTISSSRKERKKAKIPEMPRDLLEVLEALESDMEYLRHIIPAEIIVELARLKHEEYEENAKQPTAYEYERYYNL